MLALAAIFTLIGSVLGLRFKALVLVPTSGFALVSSVLLNFGSSPYPPRAQALAMIATIVALQIGYLLGLALRCSLRPKRPRLIEGAPYGPFGLTDDPKDRPDARYYSR